MQFSDCRRQAGKPSSFGKQEDIPLERSHKFSASLFPRLSQGSCVQHRPFARHWFQQIRDPNSKNLNHMMTHPVLKRGNKPAIERIRVSDGRTRLWRA